ncbi:MAG: chitobiase/beta-hexosaminidase C-terminal domain-containing protein [Bacteroidaceae bacterium]|nr:chitobiase/beta-hexosaminidase C-terminal domain-containing protein [Bacteroidaceae bacterium]
MKKFLLSILCLFSIVAAQADEVTFDFTNPAGLTPAIGDEMFEDAGNGAFAFNISGTTFSANGITISTTDGSTASRIWKSAKAVYDLRVYKTATMTVTAPSGATIENITLEGATVANITANVGTYDNKVWTGSESEVVFTWDGSAKTQKINTITVTYSVSSTVATLSKPVASVEPGSFNNPISVELSSESDGTIYYTTDGTEPTADSDVYSGAIAISEFGVTTTIKAIVINGSESSNVATFSYALKVADPVFSIEGGVYEKLSGVDALKFTTETQGATILYNNRGGDPRTEGSKSYGSLSVLSSAVIQAVAFVTNAEGDSIFSNVVKEYYTISPVKPFKVATEIVSGTKYLITANDLVAEPLYESYTYGDLFTNELPSNGDFIETFEHYGFTITETETAGEYTIQDAYNRYLYMSKTFNNFNVATDLAELGDSAIWTISIEDDCTATITNKEKGKYIQLYTSSKGYTNFGSFNEEKEGLPILYAMREYPTLTITPANWETVESITKVVVTCEEGIALNETDELYATYRDPDWNMGLDFGSGVVSEDGKSVVYDLETPLTANGDYMITFPAGLFTLDPNGLAVASEQESLSLTVDNPNVLELVYANPDGEGAVKSIEYLYFEFSQDIFDSVNGAVITDANGKEYPLSVTYTDSWGEKTPYNALCLKTAEPITEPGTYTFVLKKEYIYAGTDVRIAEDITYIFTIVEGLKVTSISPVQGTEISSINEIVVEFNQEVSCWAEAFYVTGPDGAEYFFTNSYDESIPYNTLRMVSETPITVAGEYQIYVAEVYPMGSWSDSFSGIFTINFDGSSIVTGVDKVEAEGEKVIFDLTGRRVKEINKAGIYIINGVKTIVE